ncbi:myb-like dna-binding domain protein [Cystoisospora suis]|uniref:Myb-like dna-binding domain protein n=1 Tax=Cystoisospora suis TaxID=483139 RepID=A0A2C6KYG3_9APIC|nr:myb-like dna-binding domain protein [Cystoisospora suis]
MEDETSRARGKGEGSSRSPNGSAVTLVRRREEKEGATASSIPTDAASSACEDTGRPGAYEGEENRSSLPHVHEDAVKENRLNTALEDGLPATSGISPCRSRTDERPSDSLDIIDEEHAEDNRSTSSTRGRERETLDSGGSSENQKQGKERPRTDDSSHKRRLDYADAREDKSDSPSVCNPTLSSSSSSAAASSSCNSAQCGRSTTSASSSSRSSSRVPSNRLKRGYRRSEPPPSVSPLLGDVESTAPAVVLNSSEVRQDGLSLLLHRNSPLRAESETEKTGTTACDPGGGKGKVALNGVGPSSTDLPSVKVKIEEPLPCSSAEVLLVAEETKKEQVNGTSEGTAAPSTPAPASKRRRYNSRQAKPCSVPSKSRQPVSCPPWSSSSDPVQNTSGTPATEHAGSDVSAGAAKSKSERDQSQQRTDVPEGGHLLSLTLADGAATKASAGSAAAASAASGSPGLTTSQNTLTAGKGHGSSPACRPAFVPSGMNTRKRRAQSVLKDSLAEVSDGVPEQHQKPSGGEGSFRSADSGGGRSPHTSPPARRGGGTGSSGAAGSASNGGAAPTSAAGAGAGGSAGHGEPVGSPLSISDTTASGRFSARLRQRPGDPGRNVGPPFSVVGIPSVYVRNGASPSCCTCQKGLAGLLLEPGGSTGGETEVAGSDDPPGVASQDRVIVLPRRISASAYNNLEIRARYDICQRRIRKVEAWLQMIEEWYFGSAASRWQSLHLQTIQQDQVSLYNSTKEGRRIEAVRGGGDASPGIVDPVPNPASRKTGHGSGGPHTACAGGTSAGTSASERGYYQTSTTTPGARGGGTASTGGAFSAAEAGQISEGRLPLDGGLATTDSVIYALIVSNNAERIGVMSGGGTSQGGSTGGSGISNASSGESSRTPNTGSSSSGREGYGGSGTGGGGRKGEGGGHSAKSSTHAGERTTKVNRGAGRSVTQRLGATRLTPLELLTSPLRKANVVDLWGPKEVALFEAGICRYGKDFNVLQRLIGTKSTCEIVDFYYLWKQTNRYVAWKQHRHLSKTIVHSVFG